MHLSQEISGVRYGLAEETDLAELTRLLANVFSRRDPPAVAAGLTVADFEDLIALFCPKAAAEQLTVIARASDTDRMVGALLTEDSASPAPDDLERLSSRFDPVFDILGQLDSEYRRPRQPAPREWLHLFLLGVDEPYLGRGIAQQLVAESLANGVRRGYRLAVTEATNRRSQHVFRKQGFTPRVQRSYGDYRFEDQPVFASIAGEGGPILMDKHLP